MSATVVRVRRTVAPGGVPMLIFAVDGLPYDDQPLGLDPLQPPIDAMLEFQSTPGGDSSIIADAGTAIHDRLMAHQNAAGALAGTLATPVGDPSREIRIQIETIAKAAHNLPWETLLHPTHGFIALSQDVPFSRLLPALSGDAVRTTATFDGKLKLLAVLAAVNVPATSQWTAIRQALAQWPGGDVECLILVDQPAFMAQVQAQLPGAGFTVELVPETADLLTQRIGDFAPHIVHFFCHGQSDDGGVLEVATRATALGQVPLFVRPAPLASAVRSSWLVVLNACSSGAGDPVTNSSSFACSLVEQGVPFVTSMRQQVRFNIADYFAATFLDRFVRDLARDYATRAPFNLQVAPAVTAARGTIMGKFGAASDLQRRYVEWTLPILCAATLPLEIRPVAEISEQQAIETLAAIRTLQSLLAADGVDDEKRRRIEQRIAQLERLLI
jgi:hypothetical protein